MVQHIQEGIQHGVDSLAQLVSLMAEAVHTSRAHGIPHTMEGGTRMADLIASQLAAKDLLRKPTQMVYMEGTVHAIHCHMPNDIQREPVPAAARS